MAWVKLFVFLSVSLCGIHNIEIEDVVKCWNGRTLDKCCHTMRTDTLPNLELEYLCSEPDNVTIRPPSSPDQNASSFFRLFHYHTCITRLPSNICDYPNIASVRIMSGSVQSIPSLSCLENLIALDLDGNEIQTLKRESFAGLNNLRILDLRSNRIDSIDPFAFSELPALMVVILTYNRLETVEAPWFFSIKHEFCYFDLSHNEIEHFSNEANWKYNISVEFGNGMVDFSHNKFTTWVTYILGLYGFTDLPSLGVLMPWGFDFTHNPWNCDCKMHQFLATASNFHKVIWRNYFKVACASPPHLNGTMVLDVPLNQFVCNITEKCPKKCFCQDQPDNGYVLVDCNHGNLTSLPSDLPEGKLKLVLANNRITRLMSRNYLTRTSYIDLSNNDLKFIEAESIHILQDHAKMINLSNNKLSYLPEEIQNIPFSSLSLDANPLVCDCNSSWMYTWLSLQDEDVSGVTCSDPAGRQASVLQVHSDTLRCRKVNPLPKVFSFILVGILLLFLVVLLLLVVFRYEVMILVQTALQSRNPPSDFTHDIFVSLDEEGEVERGWVVRTLLPELEGKRGLKLYLPLRDMLPGSVTTEEVIKELKQSRAVLVVLSEDYAGNASKLCELKHAYNIMMRKKRGRVIIVRMSKVEAKENNILKCFIRLKKFLEVDDPKMFDKIMTDIEIKK